LKIPNAGFREYTINSAGKTFSLWSASSSSELNPSSANQARFISNGTTYTVRSNYYAHSVRCIKD